MSTPLPASILLSRRRLLAGAALLVALLPQAVCAQWKWVDPNGVLQYSDRPPPAGTPQRSILARPAASRPPAAASGASGASPADALQRKLEQDQNARLAAQRLQQQVAEQARLANCRVAIAQLQTLNSGARIATVDSQGNRGMLDAAGLAARRQQAEAAAAQYCR